MGYRASSQASTKHSPIFMLFQQDMRLPIDAEVMPREGDGEFDEDIMDEDSEVEGDNMEKMILK